MIVKAKEQDRARIVTYCLQDPNINIFILGDIEHFGFGVDFQDVYMFLDEHKLSGIMLRYYSQYIVYIQNTENDISEIGAWLASMQPRILSGKRSVMDVIMPYLDMAYNRKDMLFATLMTQDYLIRSEISVKLAKETDVPTIARAYGQIDEFASLYTQDVDELKNQIINRINSGEGIHMFLEKDGLLIAHGNTAAETINSAILGGIFTLPAYRRQGYAKVIVSALCHDLIARGKTPCLFYENEKAGVLYELLGFRVTDEWTVLGGEDNE